MIALLFGLGMFAVILLAATRGGRSERGCALSLGLAWTLREGLARAGLTEADLVVLIDLGVLFACLGLLWRDRSAWLWAATGLQTARLATGLALPDTVDGPAWLSLGAVQAACVLAGVTRRQFGPPYLVPRKDLR